MLDKEILCATIRPIIINATKQKLSGKTYCNLSEKQVSDMIGFLEQKGMERQEAEEMIDWVMISEVEEIYKEGKQYTYQRDFGAYLVVAVGVSVGLFAMVSLQKWWNYSRLDETIWYLLLMMLLSFAPYGGIHYFISNKHLSMKERMAQRSGMRMSEILERIYALEQLSFKQFAEEYMPVIRKLMFLAFSFAFAVNAVFCVHHICLDAAAVYYHYRIVDEYDPMKEAYREGKLFCIYDADRERYVDTEYLSAEFIAKRASDVSAVLIVDSEWYKVGKYRKDYSKREYQNALQYIMEIKLYDCRTNAVVSQMKINGSMPPEEIRREDGDGDYIRTDPLIQTQPELITRTGLREIYNNDIEGDKPTNQEIREACESLIHDYYGLDLL